MLISSFYGDAFAGQFALRLKGSAKNFDIDCDLHKWPAGASEADKLRLRSKLLARNLMEHPAHDVLFVEPVRNHSSSWMMDLRCTFLVVTSGKPSARSKRI